MFRDLQNAVMLGVSSVAGSKAMIWRRTEGDSDFGVRQFSDTDTGLVPCCYLSIMSGDDVNKAMIPVVNKARIRDTSGRIYGLAVYQASS